MTHIDDYCTVVPDWMVGVSASVNVPLHHKVQKFSSGTSSPGPRVVPEKLKCRKTFVCVCVHSARRHCVEWYLTNFIWSLNMNKVE